MKKIEKLTKNQESKLSKYRDKWVDIYLGGNISNFNDVVSSHKDLYKMCGLKEPIVLYAPDPMQCQMYANCYISLFGKRDQVSDQVSDQVGNQVWSQVGNQVIDQVEDQIRNQVSAQVGNQVSAQVGNQVRDRVRDQVRNQVSVQVWNQVEDQVEDQVWNQVRNQVWNQVRNQVWNQVRNQVSAQVGNQVRDRVRDQVEDQVWNQVSDRVRDQVWNQVSDRVRDQVWNQVSAQVWNQVSAQVGNQVWNQVRNQVSAQVRNQVSAQVIDQVEDQVEDQVGNQVVDQVWNQVRNQVSDQVLSQVSAQVWNQVWNQVVDQVGNQVVDQVIDQVEDQVGNQVEDQVWNQKYNYSSYINYSDCGWLSFYDYFNKEVFTLDKSNELDIVIKASSSSFMEIQLDGLCVVSSKPVKVVRNQQNDLHNVNGYAVEFPSGYGQHYVNGRFVEPEIIENTITKEMIISEKNEDKKAAMITIVKERDGDQALLDLLEAEIVDQQTIEHNQGYSEVIRLYKTREKFDILQDRHGNMGQPYCWSEMVCPSTGQTYLIENSADFTDALEAVKWLRPQSVPMELNYQWTEFAN